MLIRTTWRRKLLRSPDRSLLPHMRGVALLLQAHPELRPAGSSANVLKVKLALMRSATTGPGQVLPHDPWYGYGVIDVARALAYL